MKALIIIAILCMTVTSYASPLTIQYKHDKVTIDSPIVDKICSDGRTKHLVKQARDSVNRKDYKDLILIGTEMLKICIEKLGGKQ